MAPVAIGNEAGGRVVDEPFWPLDAVRELVGNALLHRDLSWSVNEPVLLTMTKDSLVIRNPGGLYGISVDELGRSDVTPARNATLVSIASHVRLPGGERTVHPLYRDLPLGSQTATSDSASRRSSTPRAWRRNKDR
jgi:ATP-dependent DNA helicase RecG